MGGGSVGVTVCNVTLALEAIPIRESIIISSTENFKNTRSPTLARVLSVLLEYISTGLITGAVRSISTFEPAVTATTCVPRFPATSAKSIEKVTTPEGVEGTTC